MPYQINIFNIKVNGITQNGNLDVGPTVHNSHTANSKNFGVNFSLGDFSPSSSLQNTGIFDPMSAIRIRLPTLLLRLRIKFKTFIGRAMTWIWRK